MNKKFFILSVLIVAVVLAVGFGTVATGAENVHSTTYADTYAKPEPPKKPKVVVPLTGQKNGCADCHRGTAKLADGTVIDLTLAGKIKGIPKHPKIAAKATVKDCLKCHFKTPQNRVYWINKLHDKHLNSDLFAGTYKQSCSACHNMKFVKGIKG